MGWMVLPLCTVILGVLVVSDPDPHRPSSCLPTGLGSTVSSSMQPFPGSQDSCWVLDPGFHVNQSAYDSDHIIFSRELRLGEN